MDGERENGRFSLIRRQCAPRAPCSATSRVAFSDSGCIELDGRLTTAMTAPLRFVLDTNVVLAWLVFEDPCLAAFHARVRAREIHVLTNALAIAELERVLGYSELQLDAARRGDVLAEYRAQASVVAMPAGFSATDLLLPVSFPRCRDRDDEAFLALAFHSQAAGLVTRDKALLKLRKRARKFAVSILDLPRMMEIVSA